MKAWILMVSVIFPKSNNKLVKELIFVTALIQK